MEKNIVKLLMCQKNLCHLTPATDAGICAAEDMLGVSFANDYKEYVRTFGAAMMKGLELTGVCSSGRLSVVNTTIKNKVNGITIPRGMYVISESDGCDGGIMLQDSTGAVYMGFLNIYKKKPQKMYDSLAEFIAAETGEDGEAES